LIKTGISAVDERGALLNIKKEVSGWDFEQVKADASFAWEKELSKVTASGTKREKEIFYTALYHSFLAPVKYFDVDRRYRGLDKQVHSCEDFDNYTIFSLWDTYRALHPLFTILQPERDGHMVNSMIKHQQQHAFGVLPVWSFHGNETWCMIGYHSVPVIADAYLKGIRNYPVDEAFEAVYESAVYGPYDGLEYYMEYNFVPIDLENEGASKTLEYAYDDWTIARMAESMGNEELSRYFDFRAISFRNIFDPKTGFMRARMSNGKFREPFDPFYAQYGGDYTEGNAWQYSWYVPHDPKGLIELMGGEDKFTEKLDSLFILEVSDEKFRHVEDIAGLMGQYAHGNEPSHHIAYLYNYAGKPWNTQEKVRSIVNKFYDNTPDGLCGNEDCGQMSAWYIFSAMGFYPVCPGSNEYVIGSPSLPDVTLHLDNGNDFKISAKDLTDENIYIQSVTLNGSPLDRCFITHEEIIAGGELIFVMAAEPNKEWASGPGARPYSHSDYFSLEDYYK
jgi:predicted alpha-1,2-mannosidase